MIFLRLESLRDSEFAGSDLCWLNQNNSAPLLFLTAWWWLNHQKFTFGFCSSEHSVLLKRRTGIFRVALLLSCQSAFKSSRLKAFKLLCLDFVRRNVIYFNSLPATCQELFKSFFTATRCLMELSLFKTARFLRSEDDYILMLIFCQHLFRFSFSYL